MKRFLPVLMTPVLLTLALSASAEFTSKVAPGYLSSGFGLPVTNAYGECYLSGPVPNFKPSPDCMTHEEPMPAPTPKPAPAPVVEPPAPMPEPAKPAPEPVKVVHLNISAETLFDFDKSILRPEGKESLDAALKEVAQNQEDILHISIIGHTDWIGTLAYNQKLSERRANAVKAYLVSQGISENIVSAVGKGKTQPIASNKTAEGRQKNRRAEITFEIKNGQ